jgi:adenine-specific DNA-methyltransferase
MAGIQLGLLENEQVRPYNVPFPTTRYQGSKRSIADWIWQNISDLRFDSVIDIFGGTGAVSHMLKNAGKEITYNDALRFNWNIGLALIENAAQHLSDDDIELVLTCHPHIGYPDFISQTFANIYFTEAENRLLDVVVYNIDHLLHDTYKRSLARFALFQACIIKRPYNLFHRANLYIRTAAVERSFGNKTTWDTPFEVHFRAFAREANKAVFDNHRNNRSLNLDAFETPTGADLVYLDPPYLNASGVGVDYRDFYHFLEGLSDYNGWSQQIDFDSKHRRLRPQESIWHSRHTIEQAMDALIERHRRSTIVISYRDDGIPSKEQLISILRRYKRDVRDVSQSKQYVLSHKHSHELLLIGE